MANDIWPANLPQSLPIGTRELAEENTVKTENDWGPRNVRRRFTAVPKILEPPAERFIFTGTQHASLFTFFETTLEHGSKVFDWFAPVRTMGLVTCRFLERPTASLLAPGPDHLALYRISMRIEVLP